MPEITDLSESPYFDDYNKDNQYYKILFKPGFPLQSRELNQIQSIHHNQIENLSSVNYKDGEIVDGVNIGVNKNLNAVLLQSIVNGVYTDANISSLIGKTIKGNITNITAVVICTLKSTESPLGYPTIYVNYLSSGVIINGSTYEKFTINEQLLIDTTVVGICLPIEPTKYIGSQVSISSGVLYYKGYFLDVSKQHLFLDYYSNTPSYKIGLIIDEYIYSTTDDSSLYDNSNGFSNSNAIGADRLKINTRLSKFKISDSVPENFVEILKLVDGNIKYAINTTISHQITDAIAKRTYDLFGDFTNQNFQITTKETLNNLFNNGVYSVNSLDNNNKKIINTNPLLSDVNSINGNDYLNLQLSSGTAYIRGFEYTYNKNNSINIKKSRDYSEYLNQSLLVDCGQYFNVKDVIGTLDLSNSFVKIDLYDKSYDLLNKSRIGTAVAISISNPNSLNTDTDTRLYFVDLTTFTKITTSNVNLNLLVGDYIIGNTSKASGYVINYSNNEITIEHQTGTFSTDDVISNSRNYLEANIISVTDYNSENIKSLNNNSWNANIVLTDILLTGTSFLITNSNTITSTSAAFDRELSIGSAIKLENVSAYINNISNNQITVVGNFNNQTLSTLYKQVSIIQYNNKNLFVDSSELNIKSTDNKKFSVTKQYNVQFVNGEANVPYQIGVEIPNGIVLVQTATDTYVGKFTATTIVNLINNITFTGAATITVELFKTQPSNSIVVNSKHNILRINKTRKNILDETYGTRIEDSEISLGVCNVNKINFVRYSRLPKTSTNYVNSCFDNIVVSSSLNIEVEHILTDGISTARILLISANLIYLQYITKSRFKSNSNVTDWNNTIELHIVEANSGNYIDVTDNYKLNINDNNNIHDISKLKKINDFIVPESDLIISYDAFKSNNKDFITIDSYNNLEYSKIPNKNRIDFRILSEVPGTTGLGSVINPYILNTSGLNPSSRTLKHKSIPANNSEFIYDYTYYLGRIDLVVLNERGQFTTITGTPGTVPTPPASNKQLIISTMYIPPYTSDINDILFFNNDTRKYSMSDINNINRRLTIVEDDIELTKLESITNNTVIFDINGLNKTKTGFATDEFNGFKLSDVANTAYNAGINVTDNILVPSTTTENIELLVDYDNSVNYKKTGGILSIDYTETLTTSQLNATHSDSVNTFGEVNWEGVLESIPHSNSWITEVSKTQDVSQGLNSPNTEFWKTIYSNTSNKYDYINAATTQPLNLYQYYTQKQIIKLHASALKPNTQLILLVNNTDMGAYALPALCQVIKGGDDGTNNISFQVGEPLVWFNPNKNTLIGSKYQPKIPSSSVCGYVKDLAEFETEYNPLRLNELMPTQYTGATEFLYINWKSTKDNFDSDDYAVGSYITGLITGAVAKLHNNRIITNKFGNWEGVLIIPEVNKTNIKFNNKVLYIQLLDSLRKTTSALSAFNTYGNTKTDTHNINSLKSLNSDDQTILANQVSSNNINDITNWYNPLAQTFIVTDTGGCCLTSIDLFFLSKDTTLPIILQIRTVENNIPTEIIVPYSETIIPASSIGISSDSSIKTTAKFNSLVYLKENTKYAICILTNSIEYKLFFGKTGYIDILTGIKVEPSNNAGLLYKSQNATTWVVQNYESIKFILYKAKFKTTQVCKILLENSNTKNVSETTNNLSLTKDTNKLKVYLKNHGFHNSQNTVSIQNVLSEYPPTIIKTALDNAQTTTITNILVEQSETFPTTINNQPISTNNPGFIKINDEIILYVGVNNTSKTLLIPIGGRGQNNTPISYHAVDSIIESYILYGIPLVEINNKFNTLTPIDIDNFELTTISVSNKTTTTGGTNISISKNIQYESLIDNSNITQFPNTKVSGVINTLSTNSITGTEVPNQIYNHKFDLTNIKTFNVPMIIASKENEIANNNSNKSLTYQLTLDSTNTNISPLIDIDNISVITITNNIDGADNNEIIPVDNNSSFTYITKPIKLLSVSTGIHVILDAYRLSNHNISAYVKLYRTDTTQQLDTQNFTKLDSIKYPISGNPSQFNEFIYEKVNLYPFTEFQIKIVGKSNSQTSFPKIKNLRTISTL